MTTSSYGDGLLMVQFKPGAKAGFDGIGQQAPYILSDLPALIYPFGNSFSGNAIVVRSSDFLSHEERWFMIKGPQEQDLAL